jgi:transposase InsO family protein
MSNEVQLRFIRPGRPVENGFIESFNGRLRDECFERGVIRFAPGCPAEASEVPRTLQSRTATQRLGGSNACGLRGATQARDRKLVHRLERAKPA